MAPTNGAIASSALARSTFGRKTCSCPAINLFRAHLSALKSLYPSPFKRTSKCTPLPRKNSRKDSQPQKPQPRKRKTAMSRRKTPPPVMQQMMPRLRAHLDANKFIPRRPRRGLTPRQKIRARPSDGILEDICQKRGKEEGNRQPEQGDVDFVPGGRAC